MNQRARIAVALAIVGVLGLGALGVMAVLGRPDATDRTQESPPPPPPVPDVIAASEDVVLLGPGDSRRDLVALGSDGNERWHAERMQRPRALSDRFVAGRGGRVLDLENGVMVRLPSAHAGPLSVVGDTLVYLGRTRAEAFDAEDLSVSRWRIPAASTSSRRPPPASTDSYRARMGCPASC